MRAAGQRTKMPPRRYHIAGPQAISVPAKTEVFLQPNHWEPRKWWHAVTLPAGSLVPRSERFLALILDALLLFTRMFARRPFHSVQHQKHSKSQSLDREKKWKSAYLFQQDSNGVPRLKALSGNVDLDSRPFSGMSHEWMAGRHEKGGMVNSSINANAKFDEVCKYCVLVAYPHEILARTAA